MRETPTRRRASRIAHARRASTGPRISLVTETTATVPAPPSPATPLQGGCLCGAVRYEITAPLSSAGYCHCTHCQRRTGTGSSANGRVPRAGFRLLSGEAQLRAYQPPEGVPKLFCGTCGSALLSGDPLADEEIAVRLGTLDGDPGIRPQYRQFVASAVAWEPLPDDGLARHPGSRST
jgi:hypothetical protein